MKLAMALTERKELQTKISELSVRLKNNAKVQEGDSPSEAPEQLLEELSSHMQRLEWFITRINLTNSNTMIEGEPLTALLARRDCLKQKIGILRNFLNEASAKVDRYSTKEIKITSTVSVVELQKQLDAISRQLREVDAKIQECNWTTNLME